MGEIGTDAQVARLSTMKRKHPAADSARCDPGSASGYWVLGTRPKPMSTNLLRWPNGRLCAIHLIRSCKRSDDLVQRMMIRQQYKEARVTCTWPPEFRGRKNLQSR